MNGHDASPVPADVTIRPARSREAAAVADLTRRAFASQAELYDDDTLPPLSDTAESVTAQMAAGATVLVAVDTDDRILGSVRGELRDGCCHVGRLVVEPGAQRSGIGRALASAIEMRFPEAVRFEIFTGHLSEPALRLYESLGYTRERVVPVHERLSIVFLGK